MGIAVRYDVPATIHGPAAYGTGYTQAQARRAQELEARAYQKMLDDMRQQQATASQEKQLAIEQKIWERNRAAQQEDKQAEREIEAGKWQGQMDLERARLNQQHETNKWNRDLTIGEGIAQRQHQKDLLTLQGQQRGEITDAQIAGRQSVEEERSRSNKLRWEMQAKRQRDAEDNKEQIKERSQREAWDKLDNAENKLIEDNPFWRENPSAVQEMQKIRDAKSGIKASAWRSAASIAPDTTFEDIKRTKQEERKIIAWEKAVEKWEEARFKKWESLDTEAVPIPGTNKVRPLTFQEKTARMAEWEGFFKRPPEPGKSDAGGSRVFATPAEQAQLESLDRVSKQTQDPWAAEQAKRDLERAKQILASGQRLGIG